jgi:type IV pilus assembly protein PilF
MNRLRLWTPAAIAALLLAGCVSTGSSSNRTTDDKEAARANVQLGVAYMQQGNLALAKDKLERAWKQDSKNFEAAWALASLSERLEQPQEAERFYQTSMRLAPDNPEIANAYAVFLCKNDAVDRALPVYERVVRDPLYRTPWAAATNAAVCLRSDKRQADAAPWLERALALRPDYVPAVVELADLRISTSQPAEARAAVDRFLAIGRKSADVLLIGTRAALAAGDRAGAEAYARQLRRDFPNSAQASALQQLLGANTGSGRP